MLLVSSSTSGLSQHKSTVRPFSFHYFVELGTLHISNVLLSFVAKCWIINQQGGSDSCRLERNFVVFTLKRLTFPLFFCHPKLFSKIKFFFLLTWIWRATKIQRKTTRMGQLLHLIWKTSLFIGHCYCLRLLSLHLWCHRLVGFVIGETDAPSSSNKSFLPTEQCLQDQGEMRGKGKLFILCR